MHAISTSATRKSNICVGNALSMMHLQKENVNLKILCSLALNLNQISREHEKLLLKDLVSNLVNDMRSRVRFKRSERKTCGPLIISDIKRIKSLDRNLIIWKVSRIADNRH